jgi:hypothetical protein
MAKRGSKAANLAIPGRISFEATNNSFSYKQAFMQHFFVKYYTKRSAQRRIMIEKNQDAMVICGNMPFVPGARKTLPV